MEEIVDLLMQDNEPESQTQNSQKDQIFYSDFQESKMRLSVTPIYPKNDSGLNDEDDASKIELEITDGSSRRNVTPEVEDKGKVHSSGHANALRTDMQLRNYEPNEADGFHTVQGYKGIRSQQGSIPEADVHLWELYWNDLSRVGNGILGFFSTLYILLFHLGDIGGATIHWAGQHWWERKQESGWNQRFRKIPFLGRKRLFGLFRLNRKKGKERRINLLNRLGLDVKQYKDREGWRRLSISFDAARTFITVHLVLFHSLLLMTILLYFFYAYTIDINMQNYDIFRYVIAFIIAISIFIYLFVEHFRCHDPIEIPLDNTKNKKSIKLRESHSVCLVFIILTVLFSIAIRLFLKHHYEGSLKLSLCAAGALLAMYYFLVKKYLPFRPKVNAWAFLLGFLVFGALCLSLKNRDTFEHSVRIIMYAMAGVIRLLWFSILIVLLRLFWLQRRTKDDPVKVGIIKTAWLSIVPSILMAGSMTHLFWMAIGAILKQIKDISPPDKAHEIQIIHQFIECHIAINITPEDIDSIFLQDLLRVMGESWQLGVITSLFFVFFMAIIALLPSILQEAAPAVPAREPDKELCNRASQKLGKWLTNSPSALWFSFRLLSCILIGFLLGQTISGASEVVTGWYRWRGKAPLIRALSVRTATPEASNKLPTSPPVKSVPEKKTPQIEQASKEAFPNHFSVRQNEGFPGQAMAQSSKSEPNWVPDPTPTLKPTPAPQPSSSPAGKKDQLGASSQALSDLPGWVLPIMFGSVGLALLAYMLLIPILTRGVRSITSIVGVALDVDNYLRAFPRNATPRARMLARYNALLEQVLDQYDAVIIVAHSQGTVLSADLLRWRLLRKSLKGKAHKPIYLLTMGSPLRQLYAARFPDLYEWILKAEVSDLGVKTWVNVFRSGDFVGRSLWTPPDQEGIWDYKEPHLDALEHSKGDFCIGEGAHTHYWCRHAPEVRVVLDEMIQKAIQSIKKPATRQRPVLSRSRPWRRRKKTGGSPPVTGG